MRCHSAFFALIVVFMGLAFVPHARADFPTKWGQETQTRYSHVRSITWSGDSKYIAATSFDDDENGVRHSVAEMWDSSLENHRVFGTVDAQPISAALNQDGSRLFTGLSTGEVALWDTENGELIERETAHKMAPELLTSPNRNTVVSWDEDSVIIWNANTFERRFLITRTSQTRESVVFVFVAISPDLQTLAIGNSVGIVFFYLLKTTKYISMMLMEDRGKPYGAFFNHSGELVLGYDPKIVKLCDITTQQCREIKLEKAVYDIALSFRDQDQFTVATNDGLLWSIAPEYNALFYVLGDDIDNVSNISLSADEEFVAIGAYSGRLIIRPAPLCACF